MGSFDSRSESVHVSVDDDEDEGDDEVEDQPDVDHLDVSRCRKAFVYLVVKDNGYKSRRTNKENHGH